MELASVAEKGLELSQGHVLIVDDDAGIRDWIVRLASQMKWECSAFDSGQSLLRAIEKSTTPSCLILDVRIPDIEGPLLQRELTRRRCDIPIIVLTGYADVSLAVQAMKQGAFDFIEKPCKADHLVQRIRAAFAKHQGVLERRSEQESVSQRMDLLTPRETEILGYIVKGQASKRIAFELGLSQKTVEVHRSNIMRKFGVSGVVELVRVVVGGGHFSANAD